jgi:hypothetical protein
LESHFAKRFEQFFVRFVLPRELGAMLGCCHRTFYTCNVEACIFLKWLSPVMWPLSSGFFFVCYLVCYRFSGIISRQHSLSDGHPPHRYLDDQMQQMGATIVHGTRRRRFQPCVWLVRRPFSPLVYQSVW